jgi:hypothetical protein
MKRTQDEIVADLIRRADLLEQSAGNPDIKHTKPNRLALRLCARVLRVAAEQNCEAQLNVPRIYIEKDGTYLV